MARAVHTWIDECLRGCLGIVAVEFDLVLGPDGLFRGAAGLYAGSLQDEGRARGVLPEADALRIVVAADSKQCWREFDHLFVSLPVLAVALIPTARLVDNPARG